MGGGHGQKYDIIDSFTLEYDIKNDDVITHRYVVLGPGDLRFGYAGGGALEVHQGAPVHPPVSRAVHYLNRGCKIKNIRKLNSQGLHQ